MGNTDYSHPCVSPGKYLAYCFPVSSPQCLRISSHVCSDWHSVKDSRGPLWRSGKPLSFCFSLPLSFSAVPSSSVFCPQILAVSAFPNFMLTWWNCQVLFTFPFTYCSLKLAVSWGNHRAHLVCFFSHGDPSPVLLVVQCLKTIVIYALPSFLLGCFFFFLLGDRANPVSVKSSMGGIRSFLRDFPKQECDWIKHAFEKKKSVLLLCGDWVRSNSGS